MIEGRDNIKLNGSPLFNKETHFTLNAGFFIDGERLKSFKKFMMTIPKNTRLRGFKLHITERNKGVICSLCGISCESFILNFKSISSLSSEKIQILDKIITKAKTFNIDIIFRFLSKKKIKILTI